MVQGLTSAKGTYAVHLVVHEKFLTESVCRDVCKYVWIPELTLFTSKLMNFHITYTPCMEFLSTFGWNVWQMHVGKYTIYEAYMSPQPTTFGWNLPPFSPSSGTLVTQQFWPTLSKSKPWIKYPPRRDMWSFPGGYKTCWPVDTNAFLSYIINMYNYCCMNIDKYKLRKSIS